MTTVGLVGTERAVALATESMSAERVAGMLAYLQPPALTRRQLRQVSDDEIDLDDLRAAVSDAIGVDKLELQQLRRITVGSIIRVLLPALAVIAILATVSNISIDELIDDIKGAIWWLVALGFLIAQTPRVAQSMSTLGASPIPLPLGPVYALQLAMSYINLAIPSTAARVATSVRFFQRHGLATGAALATGAIDGFAGFVVQACLMLMFFLFTPLSLDLNFSGVGGSIVNVLLIAVGIAIVAVIVMFAVEKWRRAVLGWLGHALADAWTAVRGIRTVKRVVLLFGGNLASDLLFALALTTFVRAFGYSVGFDEVLLVNIVVSLFAGLLPIPGGVGVTEGGLTYGLVQAGVPESTAFAAVILYRMSTFYLPPIWGYFAFRWLERNDHL
jgi:uncharacterized protein (TIRG00374 family)